MNKSRWPARMLLSLAVMAGACLPLSHAAAPAETDLQKISREISTTEARLKKSRQEQDELTARLQKTEQKLGRIEREKRDLQQAIDALGQELAKLHEEEQQLAAARARQEQAIAAQVNASYRLGHGNNLRVLLSQEDSRAVGRALAYADYLARARMAAITAYESTLAGIAANKESIHLKTAELESSRQALAQQQEKAKESYAKRNDALQGLQATIQTDASKISQLKQNRAQLQELLRQIRARQLAAEKAAAEAAAKARREEEARRKEEARRLAAQPGQDQPVKTEPTATGNAPRASAKTVQPLALPADHLPFAKAKGRLRWPVRGRLDNRYGRPRQPGDFRWEGIAFIASAGTEVQAVHGGRVVFADWFRGKGLLVIIDHGNGYMTLYAHNQSLLKKAGELVKPGEPIATLGDSGGLVTPELYFELRHQGEPVNPTPWLSRNG